MGCSLEWGQCAMRHLLIWGNTARWADLSRPDVMAVPPTASLIAEADWKRMCVEAGGEGLLLKTLGIKEVADDNGEGASDTGDIAERKG